MLGQNLQDKDLSDQNSKKFSLDFFQPVFILIFTLLIIIVPFVAYDQFSEYQSGLKSQKLIDKIVVKPDCDQIVIAGAQVNFKFSISNQNNESIFLKKILISSSFLESGENKAVKEIEVSPKAKENGDQNPKYKNYDMIPKLQIGDKKSTTLKITLKTSDTATTGAKKHTISVYKGDVKFVFDPGITITSGCIYQVRNN